MQEKRRRLRHDFRESRFDYRNPVIGSGMLPRTYRIPFHGKTEENQDRMTNRKPDEFTQYPIQIRFQKTGQGILRRIR